MCEVGSLSLYTSCVAQHPAYRTDVREFADFETAEQITMAEILPLDLPRFSGEPLAY